MTREEYNFDASLNAGHYKNLRVLVFVSFSISHTYILSYTWVVLQEAHSPDLGSFGPQAMDLVFVIFLPLLNFFSWWLTLPLQFPAPSWEVAVRLHRSETNGDLKLAMIDTLLNTLDNNSHLYHCKVTVVLASMQRHVYFLRWRREL